MVRYLNVILIVDVTVWLLLILVDSKDVNFLLI